LAWRLNSLLHTESRHLSHQNEAEKKELAHIFEVGNNAPSMPKKMDIFV